MYCLSCGCQIELGSKFCSNCGSPTPISDKNNMGKINVVRESKVFGFAIPFDVYVDDAYLGKLSNGTTLSCDVALGSHVVLFKSTEKDVVEEIYLTEDKRSVTLDIVPKMGLIAAKPSIKNISYN